MSKTDNNHLIEWPYPIEYGKEKAVETGVLIIGGGVAGCFAAISAAKKGADVAIVEKGATVRSGGAGAGIDHWQFSATNPASGVTPEELTEGLIKNHGGWNCGLTTYIQCRESYDALLELEKYGMKIRDNEDEFKGADFRDEATKLLFCYEYKNKYSLRIWGKRMKPVLYKECRRLGVKIYDRIMATSLLTEDGKQGGRVLGAMGVNTRTGEFSIFKAKATVSCLARPSQGWFFDSEHTGFFTPEAPAVDSGDGHAMAWRAGAEFTLMEKSAPLIDKGPMGFGQRKWLTGACMATLHPCSIVDSKGKEVPWVNAKGESIPSDKRTYPVYVPGQKYFLMGGGSGNTGPMPPDLKGPMIAPEFMKVAMAGMKPAGYTPPFFADLPSMPEHERRVIFGLMVGQEGMTSLGYRDLASGGYDPDKDMLQVYSGSMMPKGYRCWSVGPNGGMVPDWNLRSSLEGLYGAGRFIFGGEDCSNAAATGRYAGRKAAEYALGADDVPIEREQIENEKRRVYAPVQKEDGIDWKELNIGICRIMQDYCGDWKNEELLHLGLKWFSELRDSEVKDVYARNPHELVKVHQTLNMLDIGEAIMHASLARKASSAWIGFDRLDYPEIDPSEWKKWITVRLDSGNVETGEKPIDYWGDLETNYEKHCGL